VEHGKELDSTNACARNVSNAQLGASVTLLPGCSCGDLGQAVLPLFFCHLLQSEKDLVMVALLITMEEAEQLVSVCQRGCLLMSIQLC